MGSSERMCYVWILFVIFFVKIISSTNLNFVIFYQEEHQEMTGQVNKIFDELESSTSIKLSKKLLVYNFSETDEEFQQNLCSKILDKELNIVLDLVWSTNKRIHKLCNALEIPYFRLDVSLYPFLDPVIKFLKEKNVMDSVFIVQSEMELDQALYTLIEKSNLKILVVNQLSRKTARRLANMRPVPGFFAVIGSTENVNTAFEMAIKSGLVQMQERWGLVFMDPFLNKFEFNNSYQDVTKFLIDRSLPCIWRKTADNGGDCNWPEGGYNHVPSYLNEVLTTLVDYFKEKVGSLTNLDCSTPKLSNFGNITTLGPEENFFHFISTSPTLFRGSNNEIKFHLKADIIGTLVSDLNQTARSIGTYYSQNGIKSEVNLPGNKRYLRVGTAFAVPWSYYKLDPVTGQPFVDHKGNHIWEGYCIEFIEKLSKLMNFKYDLIEPTTGSFGENTGNGQWNGLVGDLMTGEIDMAVSAMKMTAEREEVIDFVVPYFEQTGISIVIRKPVRVTSLFKFMTVLRLEVWLSIVAALVSTAIMIWLLDKYSPYSARNNKEAYPYPCRDFSLKESFWFALTSFTPQGGGEAPKALSGRTLVAAYWLFVVLMLATFTANLAAFLTVERMQTPVQSLDQLARQSRINYTVVEGSETHQYFINMKFAEDTLYRVWKEITLNSTTDQAKYRVWDYPIKEQYGQTLLAINRSNPVKDAAAGFRLVNEHLNADFAFIHDSAEIKYEISKNCNLTEVGEVFAEQPYALAVQQGSNLLDEISLAMLNLQKDRFFELMNNKYWNNSKKGDCSNSDDSEGISLESLGGVFIATLFGLGIAMVTLVFEVIYYRRKNAKEAKEKQVIRVKPVLKQEKMVKKTCWSSKKNKVTIGGGTDVPARPFGLTRQPIHEHKYGEYIE